MKCTLTWFRWSLFAVAVTLLTYSTGVYLETYLFQQQKLPVFLHQGSDVPPVAGLIGRLEVTRLGLSAIVMEGTGTAVLRHAAGHIAGTPLPGQPGNTGISAHRDTLFRPLRNIRMRDVITLTTPQGTYKYSVRSTQIVEPENITVLASGPGETLTLVTCYPFYFIGPAPKRFIVTAKRIL